MISRLHLFGIIKNQIINGLGNKNELTNLIDSLNSVDTIDKILNDDSIDLPDIIQENLLKKRTCLRTKEVYNEKGDIIGNIEFTDGEIKEFNVIELNDNSLKYYRLLSLLNEYNYVSLKWYKKYLSFVDQIEVENRNNLRKIGINPNEIEAEIEE